MRAAFLAVVLAAGPAAAQTAPEARARFGAGLAAVDRGDYEAALAEFEAARAIEETAKIVYNVAGCLKALHRYAEALAAYERVAAIGVDGLPAANRPNVATFVEELRARVAWLSVRTNPEGAAVSVDGRAVERMPIAIDPGAEVEVEATLEGHRTARTATRPGAPGPIDVSLVLEPMPAAPPAPSLTVALPASAEPPPPEPARPESARRGGILPWILAGAAVVALGAGTGLFFALQPEEMTGDARVTGP